MDSTLTSTAHSTAPSNTHTALVLGGGGSTGNAWLIGVAAGLYANGLDVTGADLMIGTSAGATAAAQFAGASPQALLAAILEFTPGAVSAPSSPSSHTGSPRPTEDHLSRLHRLIASSGDAADYRRRLGAAAVDLAAAAGSSWQEQWRGTVAARLAKAQWPQCRLLLTAVDASTGEPVVFDRHGGVDLVDAVAASCSSGPAYRIGDRLYIEGGFRTNADNADLAAGAARVLVLSPLSGAALTPVGWGTHLETQVAGLRAQGTEVEVLVPEPASAHLFGANAMDLSLRPLAAQAGYDQGRAHAGRLRAFWSGVVQRLVEGQHDLAAHFAVIHDGEGRCCVTGGQHSIDDRAGSG